MEQIVEGIEFDVKKGKKEKKTKHPSTKVILILDASGSMRDHLSATISGVNEFLGDRRVDKGKVFFSLTQFNTSCHVQHVDTPMKLVTDINPNTYAPEGGTALYDAIGTTLESLEKSPLKVDRHLVLIITDGFENASKEFSRDKVRTMIQEREGRGNWSFTYMGANQDCWAEAGGIGIKHGNIASYNPIHTNQAFGAMSVGTSVLMRSAVCQTDSFYAGEAEVEPITPQKVDPVIPGSTADSNWIRKESTTAGNPNWLRYRTSTLPNQLKYEWSAPPVNDQGIVQVKVTPDDEDKKK